VDGVGLGLCKNTWMFPAVDPIGVRDKTEPDPISTVEKIVEAKTGTLSKESITIKLLSCPFWLDNSICPLKERFKLPAGLSEIDVEYLKYPIRCPLANFYKCRYIKPYYYGIRREYTREELSSFNDE